MSYRAIPLSLASFRFSVEAGDSLLNDAQIVAFRLIGEKAVGDKIHGALRQCGVFVENLIHPGAHQADFCTEPIKIPASVSL